MQTAVRLAATLFGVEGVAAKCKAGVHVGPIIGCVLGRDRLSFDILGDAVNQSSRLYSTSQAGDISLSDDAYAMLRKVDTRMYFTEARREMKGKGLVRVHVHPALARNATLL